MAKPDGHKKRNRIGRGSAASRFRSATVDAQSQLDKWKRLEGTLEKKKYGNRSINEDPAQQVKRTRKSLKRKEKGKKNVNLYQEIDKSHLLVTDEIERPTGTVNTLPSRPLTIKQRARMSLADLATV